MRDILEKFYTTKEKSMETEESAQLFFKKWLNLWKHVALNLVYHKYTRRKQMVSLVHNYVGKRILDSLEIYSLFTLSIGFQLNFS